MLIEASGLNAADQSIAFHRRIIEVNGKEVPYTTTREEFFGHDGPPYFRADKFFVINYTVMKRLKNGPAKQKLLSMLNDYRLAIIVNEAEGPEGWTWYAHHAFADIATSRIPICYGVIGMLLAMQHMPESERRGIFVDAGSRNGFMAMAALRLGWPRAVAIDNNIPQRGWFVSVPDEERYGIIPEEDNLLTSNLKLNGLRDRVEIYATNLSEAPSLNLQGGTVAFNLPQFGSPYENRIGNPLVPKYEERASFLTDVMAKFSGIGFILATGEISEMADGLLKQAETLGLSQPMKIFMSAETSTEIIGYSLKMGHDHKIEPIFMPTYIFRPPAMPVQEPVRMTPEEWGSYFEAVSADTVKVDNLRFARHDLGNSLNVIYWHLKNTRVGFIFWELLGQLMQECLDLGGKLTEWARRYDKTDTSTIQRGQALLLAEDSDKLIRSMKSFLGHTRSFLEAMNTIHAQMGDTGLGGDQLGLERLEKMLEPDVAIEIIDAVVWLEAFSKRAEVPVIIDGDSMMIRVDALTLERILSNLINNARADGNAFENPQTHEREPADVRISLHRERGQIVLTVLDNGRGMSPDQLGRVQAVLAHEGEPRFTTKENPSGTLRGGLGLRIVRRFSELIGAHVTVVSRPQTETTPPDQREYVTRFEVRIPEHTVPLPAGPGDSSHTPSALRRAG